MSDRIPETPKIPGLIRENVKEGEVIWRDPSGAEKIHISRSDLGTRISFTGEVIPGILQRMDSLNEGNTIRNHALESEEGAFNFEIEPNNNPNLQWRDLATQIDMWLRSSK